MGKGMFSKAETRGSLPAMRRRRAPLTAVLGIAMLVLAACGDSGESSGTPGAAASDTAPAQSASTGAMQHIHGLGVRGRTLFIATHGGLWAAPDGQTEPQRVGQSQQDVMGFSVLSNDRFIGSGHPHPSQQDLPPNLGLIESRDRGRTWKNISLLGEADFHVLESSGTRIYGFDGTQGRLMVSSDKGRSWQQRTPPAGIFALAIDPADRDRIVVSTGRGVFTSPDAGRSWRLVDARLAGLLAWPQARELYLVDGQGQPQLSRDGGRGWQTAGSSIGGQPAAFIATGGELYAALEDARVKRSTDGGRTWTLRATP
jgi:hypothetical protein